MTSETIGEPVAVPKKKENLKQRAYLNSLSSFIDYAGAQITGFIINPFIVSGLGAVMYGVWQILTQLTGYTKLADTRASQVLKWSVANKRAVATEEELKSDLASAFYVTAFTMPLALIVGAIISWYAPIIAQADLKYYTLIRATCSILIFGLVVNKFFDLFEATLAGMNLGYKRMGFRAAVIAIGGVLKVLAITNGYGLIGLSIIQVLNSAIIGITFYFIVKKNVPWFSFGKTSSSNIKAFGKLSGWFMLFSVLKMLLLNSDKVFLGYLAGPKLVSEYALTMFTSTAIQGAMIAVITGMTPGICTLFGKGEYDRVMNARKKVGYLTRTLCVAIGTGVLLLNKSFIQLWVGTEHYAGNIENLLILIIAVQAVFFQLDSTVLNANMDIRKKVWLSACAAILSMLLSLILVPRFQIVGLCISTIIGRLFYSIGFPLLLTRRMNIKASLIDGAGIRMMIVALLLFVGATIAGGNLHITNWLLLMVVGAVAVLVAGGFVLFIGMNKQSRIETWQSVSNIKLLKSN